MTRWTRCSGDPEVREGFRRLRTAHRRMHRATARANEESLQRAAVIARLRENGVPLHVIAKNIGVTIPAVQGILRRAAHSAHHGGV